MSIKDSVKLYIHIGPPKTGTTSIQQYFLDDSSKNKINYLGIVQPRTVDDLSFCKTIYNQTISDAPSWLTDLENYLSSEEINFCSEEMFLVDSINIKWQEKLENLYKIVNHLDPILLVTVRNPISCIRSYYQEMFLNIDNSKFDNINTFAISNYCLIYNYNFLEKTIKEIGFNHRFLSFNRLIKNQYKMNDLFNNGSMDSIILKKSNKSNKSTKGHFANNSKVKDFFKFRMNAPVVTKNRLLNKFLKIKLNNIIPLNVDLNQSIKNEMLSEFENFMHKHSSL